MDTKKRTPKRPEGKGWYRYGQHWERIVEGRPCRYCGCTQYVQSTYAWPYCLDCKAT